MGCDIHAYVEVKINGEWHYYNEVNIERWYDLFALMANVRNYDRGITPISDPRGLPEDIDYMTQFIRDSYGLDGHSDSWLSSEEVCKVGAWMIKEYKEIDPNKHYYLEKFFGFIFGNGWDIEENTNFYPDGFEDARLVFWFDN